MKVYVGEEQLIQLEARGESRLFSQKLEERIKLFVKPISEDSDPLPDITIRSRYDCHLLECRRSVVPIESILGVLEDSIEEGMENNIDVINPSLDVTILQGQTDPVSWSTDLQRYELIKPPHSEWIRKPKSINKVFGIQEATKIQFLWVDLRNNVVALSSPADCCLFLRSLLGSSHGANPWGHYSKNGIKYDMVAVLLTKASEVLEKFRTSDASPSFFLHSITQLQIPLNSIQWWKQGVESHTNYFVTDDATLYIYRRLPPRDLLKHPTDLAEEVPSGCLLETYFRQSQTEENNNKGEKMLLETYVRPIAPPYISYKQDYPGLLEPLLEDIDIIFDEATSIPQWTAWPERNHYSSSPGNPNIPTWTVFPLCHCFPANDVNKRKWIEITCVHVPKTTAILKQYLGDTLRTALFSRLEPETTLEAHTGWEDLANHVYRVHIPLRVPPDGLCGTWVDGVVETHERGRPICFDDSKIHRAFNYSKFDRIVLIIDLERPQNLPIGTANGGHTEELDSFINALT